MKKTVTSQPCGEQTSQRLTQAGAAVESLAHLTKNILQVLSGCSEIIDLALNTNQIDRVRQAWQLHQPCFWRLKKFQLDLIKFTKAYPLNLEPCNLNAVVAAAVRQLDPFFTKRSIGFVAEVADDLPAVTADSEKLRDAIINLLVTAVDNLQDEPGQIFLNASLTKTPETVQITVSDSGPRLDAETRKALLTPYERCRNMLGTGLEIPLTNQIAEAHGGRLLINPDTADTNSLIVTLPVNP